jgi:hypothetical protein
MLNIMAMERDGIQPDRLKLGARVTEQARAAARFDARPRLPSASASAS